MTSITGIEYMKDPQDVTRPGAPSYPVITGPDGNPCDIGLHGLLSLLGLNDGTAEGIAREAQTEAEVLDAILALLRRRWFDGARQALRLFDAFPRFYIASDDPGANGNPGLVLYRTLTQEERAAAKAEGSHLAGDPWSIWLTEDVLAVAEASGLLDESIGTSAASARKWLQEDAKADQIRRQISHLEAELSRISGEPLDLEYHDLPAGGAILEYAPAVSEYGFRHWYPTTEAAKAALLKMARDAGTTPDPDGLHADMSPPAAQYSTRAWITRR